MSSVTPAIAPGMSRFKHIHMSCREDIFSADQAIEAVATLLHEVAPDGDVGAAADALRQVRSCCGPMYVDPAAQHNRP